MSDYPIDSAPGFLGKFVFGSEEGVDQNEDYSVVVHQEIVDADMQFQAMTMMEEQQA